MTAPVLTYDTLTVGRWYLVTGQTAQLYLREKRKPKDGEQGYYRFTVDSEGPSGGTGIVIRDLAAITAVPAPAQSWFVASGDQAADVARLVRLLCDKLETDGFAGPLGETKVGGVRKAYLEGVGGFASLLAFAVRAAALTDWGADGQALEDVREDDRLAAFIDRAGPVTEMRERDFRREVAELNLYEVGAKGDHLEYDRAYAIEAGGIWTDHMGPCITVLLSGVSRDGGRRYNGLLHSFGDATGAQILDTLQGHFNGRRGVPTYATLDNVVYYVVGGSPIPTSVDKAQQLIKEMHQRKLTVRGITLTTHVTEAGLSKAAMITPAGEVYWMSYR